MLGKLFECTFEELAKRVANAGPRDLSTDNRHTRHDRPMQLGFPCDLLHALARCQVITEPHQRDHVLSVVVEYAGEVDA